MLTKNERELCDSIQEDIERMNNEIAKIIEGNDESMLERIKKLCDSIATRCKEREEIISGAKNR